MIYKTRTECHPISQQRLAKKYATQDLISWKLATKYAKGYRKFVTRWKRQPKISNRYQ